MAFDFREFQIREIVKAQKCLREGSDAEVENDGSAILLDTRVADMDNPHFDLRFKASASDPQDPETYHAILILDDERIRGVDFQKLGKKRWYKTQIPDGWHQNILNPNLPKSHPDYNRHDAIPDFDPKDFDDFVRNVTALWNIVLKQPDEVE